MAFSATQGPLLKDKVVIIGGAGGGIGKAVCRQLIARGASIVASGRPGPSLDGLLTLVNHHPKQVLIHPTDLSRPWGWEEVVAKAVSEFGRADVLIHTVGVLRPGEFSNLDRDAVDEMVRTDLLGVMYAVRAVLPAMKCEGRGHIIILGSLGGIVPMPFVSVYSACKFAIRGFSLSLDTELRSAGIRVSHLACGPVRTKMLDQEMKCKSSTISFINAPLSPEDVASAVYSLILHPRSEIVLPRIAGSTAKLVCLASNLFGRLYPLFDRIGARRAAIHQEATNG